jgi:hypothetical protein
VTEVRRDGVGDAEAIERPCECLLVVAQRPPRGVDPDHREARLGVALVKSDGIGERPDAVELREVDEVD